MKIKQAIRQIRMLRRVKNYEYYVERLVCLYVSFTAKAPMHMFTTRRKDIQADIAYLQQTLEANYKNGLFRFFYEYNACRRFLNTYAKVAKRWYWLFRIV